jgi:hypothetical protein
MPPEDALVAARRAFGNRTIAEERFYESTMAVSLAAGIMFGLAPALDATRGKSS